MLSDNKGDRKCFMNNRSLIYVHNRLLIYVHNRLLIYVHNRLLIYVHKVYRNKPKKKSPPSKIKQQSHCLAA